MNALQIAFVALCLFVAVLVAERDMSVFSPHDCQVREWSVSRHGVARRKPNKAAEVTVVEVFVVTHAMLCTTTS